MAKKRNRRHTMSISDMLWQWAQEMSGNDQPTVLLHDTLVEAMYRKKMEYDRNQNGVVDVPCENGSSSECIEEETSDNDSAVSHSVSTKPRVTVDVVRKALADSGLKFVKFLSYELREVTTPGKQCKIAQCLYENNPDWENIPPRNLYGGMCRIALYWDYRTKSEVRCPVDRQFSNALFSIMAENKRKNKE